MKRTSFFYEKKLIWIVIFLWLLLFDTAYAMNTKKEEKDIRVLLTDSEFQSCYHPDVILTWQGRDYEFHMGEETEGEGCCTFEGGEEGIRIPSIRREQGTPVYKGTIKLIRRPEGYLIVNILPLEEYLKGVVPSEMPASYPLEALKAQAVCARTYACRQMEQGGLEEYGADVDDSVSYQVYNNIGEESTSNRAIEETEGKILTQNHKLVDAYYFSTSAGFTSTDEIWGARTPSSYLKSVPCEFDALEPWRTWETALSWECIQERAKSREGCKGRLTGIQITRKSESGAVTGLCVYTEQGSCNIETEYQVRSFLEPENKIYTGVDREEKDPGRLLPSAYFTLEIKEGSEILIKGAGYGHGVGMSQTAAGKMAEEGYTFQDILQYFFKDVEILER